MLRASGYPLDPSAIVERMSSPGAMTAALNWYRAMDADLVALGRITVPTLYVWSTNDVALGREGAEGTATYVDGPYRFEVLDGVSHWIPEEVPDVLNQLLLEHLGSGP
jgi:pimeloyl-ACP methyl ester carboxylesterase